jgi:hypothetical protein
MNRDALNAQASVLQRLAPWAGIVFAVLLVVGFLLAGDTPEGDDKQAWVDFHADSGNRVQQIIGGLLVIASGVAFLWFGHALVARLAGSRGGEDVLTAIARSAVTLLVAMLIAAALAAVTVSASIEIGDVAEPETGDFGIQFDQLAFGFLLVGACVAAAVVIACISELARQRGVWPRWLVWAGFIAAILLIFGVLFFPVVLIPLWALVVSIVLLVRPQIGEPLR